MGIRIHVNKLFSSISYNIDKILVDPGDEWEGFYGVEAVFLTHAHFDHIYGVNEVLKRNPNVQIFTNSSGRKMLLDPKLNLSYYHETPIAINFFEKIIEIGDGEVVNTGNGLKAKAIYTLGHNPSCITWIIDDYLFTGDSYIPGAKIVTNLPKGNKEQALKSLELIKSLIGPQTIICPGHYVENIL